MSDGKSKASFRYLKFQVFILMVTLLVAGGVLSPALGTSQTVIGEPASTVTREALPMPPIIRDDPNLFSVNVPVSGAGTTGKLVLSPKKLTFPKVAIGSAQTHSLTLKNSGKGVLEGTVGTLNPPFEVLSGGGAFHWLPGPFRR